MKKLQFLMRYRTITYAKPYRTRKQVPMGTFIRDPFGLVEVCGMGWEGDSFVLHVRDVFTSPHAAELLDDYWEPGEAMAARDAFGMEDE